MSRGNKVKTGLMQSRCNLGNQNVTRVTRARQATDVLMGIVVRPATDGVAILRVIARKNGTSSIIIPKFSHVTRLEPPLTPAFCDVQISYANFLAFLIFAFLIFFDLSRNLKTWSSRFLAKHLSFRVKKRNYSGIIWHFIAAFSRETSGILQEWLVSTQNHAAFLRKRSVAGRTTIPIRRRLPAARGSRGSHVLVAKIATRLHKASFDFVPPGHWCKGFQAL